jgi:hypothetical protein
MTDEELYRDMKALQRHPEWKTFEAHIKDVAYIHRDSSVSYSAKGKTMDAQRQAWIAEGLLEAIEEPQEIVKRYEFSVTGIYERVCHLCGTILGKVKA